MNDTDSGDNKSGGRGRTGLGGGTGTTGAGNRGQVRQNFSHGRSKAVVVEVVRKRTLGPRDPAARDAAAAVPAAVPAAAAPVKPAATPAATPPTAAPARPVAPSPRPAATATPAAAPRAAEPVTPPAPPPPPVVAAPSPAPVVVAAAPVAVEPPVATKTPAPALTPAPVAAAAATAAPVAPAPVAAAVVVDPTPTPTPAKPIEAPRPAPVAAATQAPRPAATNGPRPATTPASRSGAPAQGNRPGQGAAQPGRGPQGDRAPQGGAGAAAQGAKPRQGRPNMLRTLSDDEYARRLVALKQAKKDEEARLLREAADEKRRAAEDAAHAEAEARRKAEEEAKAKAIAAEALEKGLALVPAAVAPRPQGPRPARPAAKTEAVVLDPAAAEAAAARAAAGVRGPAARPAAVADDDDRTVRRAGPGGAVKKAAATPRRTDEDRRRAGKLTISKLGDDEGGRQRSMAAMKRRQERDRRKMGGVEVREKFQRDVRVPDAITVQELANRMAERVADVIKALMRMDVMATQNQLIDSDTAELIVEEFGHKMVRVSEADVENVIETAKDDEQDLEPRAPVVTIMGHVDHGKTSLLDALRKTNVVSGEAGGITQHIGAYQIVTGGGHKITFLDTPGHAAFTSMRARGAKVTDIVVLVVAADDAVMPQTVEAIAHAKAANVPMIVAINKMDKYGADPEKVRTDLLRHDVVVEKMSGEVMDVEVSAVSRMGLDQLVDAIVLQAEVLELRANPDRPAEGAVIEAKLDVGRGPVATVLIQRGTLRLGDIFVVGEQWGKVRALINDKGERVEEAGPSVPVEVLGLGATPQAGDVLNVVEDESKAREIADYRQRKGRDANAVSGARATLETLLAQAKTDENVKELPLVVKCDVQGSAEAIVQSLSGIGNDEVRIRILHSGVGAITESDVTLAEASGAPIIGFNVRANAPAREAAHQKGVEIRYYSIIYNLVDDVKQAASGLLSPEVKETFIGYATIKQVFKVSGVGKVAGCIVTEGIARRSAGVRLLRDNVVIHQGKLKTLKRFKDEVKEVNAGQECGMAFENYEDIREADVIEIFESEEIQRTL